jgi:branched-chain amino acid aminotransferase
MTSNFYIVDTKSLGGTTGMGTDKQLTQSKKSAVERNAALITARYGILLGVTRRAVLHLARNLGMPILYRAPNINENYTEAFLTSSSRGIVPVVFVDDNMVGEGIVGTWTRRLIQSFHLYVEKHSEMITKAS